MGTWDIELKLAGRFEGQCGRRASQSGLTASEGGGGDRVKIGSDSSRHKALNVTAWSFAEAS